MAYNALMIRMKTPWVMDCMSGREGEEGEEAGLLRCSLDRPQPLARVTEGGREGGKEGVKVGQLLISS